MKLENIYHRYNSLKIIDNLTLSFNKNEIVSLVGKSGCGKTTLLKILAGFIIPSNIKTNSKYYRNEPNSNIVYVSQNQLLFPWMTVQDNILFALKSNLSNKREINNKLKYLINLVELSHFENFYPKQLSGGMKQRASIARALAVKPTYLLLDEPFSALDDISRMELENKLIEVQQKIGISIILVTHNLDEAVYLSNRVIILSKRPASVIKEINIEIPFPRHDVQRSTQKFLNYKETILKNLL